MRKEIEKINEEIRDDRGEYYKQVIKQHNIETQKFRMQTPEEKTNRQWECIIKTKYLMRNKWQEPNPQRVEMIKKAVLAWFQENKNDPWCDSGVYEKLLPPAQGGVVAGWQRVGEIVK